MTINVIIDKFFIKKTELATRLTVRKDKVYLLIQSGILNETKLGINSTNVFELLEKVDKLSKPNCKYTYGYSLNQLQIINEIFIKKEDEEIFYNRQQHKFLNKI